MSVSHLRAAASVELNSISTSFDCLVLFTWRKLKMLFWLQKQHTDFFPETHNSFRSYLPYYFHILCVCVCIACWIVILATKLKANDVWSHTLLRPLTVWGKGDRSAWKLLTQLLYWHLRRLFSSIHPSMCLTHLFCHRSSGLSWSALGKCTF